MLDWSSKDNHDEKVAALQEAIDSWSASESAPIVDTAEEEALQSTIAKATRLINHRPRSEHELRERLLAKDCEPEAVEKVIARCHNSGMLDDAEFARMWVEQRATHQKKSKQVLRRELQNKGVAQPIIDEALDQLDPDDQHTIMEELVVKKAKSIKTVPADYREYEKYLRRIVGVVARRGFPQGEGLQAARNALDCRIDELKNT